MPGITRLPSHRATVTACAVLALLAQGLAPRAGEEAPVARPVAGETQPPRGEASVRFAVIGDSGTGGRAQYAIGARLAASRETFPFDFVLLLGDNLYGSERPQDFARKFEAPYAPLLARNVEFYASLGNHDDPNQRFYKPFHMNGERFYTFRKKHVQFFALDSNYMDQQQQAWLERELSRSRAAWKVAFFHHPIYSSGAQHGSEMDLREVVEPLFVRYGVSVVFAGHEHFYERIQPQKGIHYFTSGSAGKLRTGDIRPGALTARGFDTDHAYMLVEILETEMHFQALSRAGRLVDSGRLAPPPASGRGEEGQRP